MDGHGHFEAIFTSIDEELCIKIKKNIQISKQKYLDFFFSNKKYNGHLKTDLMGKLLTTHSFQYGNC